MRYYPEFYAPMTRKFEPGDLHILTVIINGIFFLTAIVTMSIFEAIFLCRISNWI